MDLHPCFKRKFDSKNVFRLKKSFCSLKQYYEVWFKRFAKKISQKIDYN